MKISIFNHRIFEDSIAIIGEKDIYIFVSDVSLVVGNVCYTYTEGKFLEGKDPLTICL